MTCQNCGFRNPEGNNFCQNCGVRLVAPACTEDLPEATAIPEVPAAEFSAAESVRHMKKTFCSACGSEMEAKRKKCPVCGKRHSHAGFVVFIILLVVLLLAAAGVGTVLYLYGEEANTIIAAQTTDIETLEDELSAQKSTNEDLRMQVAALSKKTGYYDTICRELLSGNLGYAANNFKSSESIIVVSKNQRERKFTLTANWPNGGTVTPNYAGSSAYVTFDNNSWTTSTTMTIMPQSEGVTVVTFTNDADANTFKILILVTE